jgi:hypothetical protein
MNSIFQLGKDEKKKKIEKTDGDVESWQKAMNFRFM